MEIARAGSQPSTFGSADTFTGAVRRDPLFDPPSPSTMAGSSVTFEPGARTAWHTHPLGQVLIVTAGLGWIRSWGQARQEMRPGDVVWIAPYEKHWHGATGHTGLTHIAITQSLEGRNVEWLELVREEHFTHAEWQEPTYGGNRS